MEIIEVAGLELVVRGGEIYLHAGEVAKLELDDIDAIKRKLDEARLVAVEQQAAIPVVPGRPHDPHCPYTHAHTRNWCGYPLCRQS